jgi:hypothetical protein
VSVQTHTQEQSIRCCDCDGLQDRRVVARFPAGQGFFSAKQPDRLWYAPSLLFNGYVGRFPQSERGRGVKVTTHFCVENEWSYTATHTSSWRAQGQNYSRLGVRISCSNSSAYRRNSFLENCLWGVKRK